MAKEKGPIEKPAIDFGEGRAERPKLTRKQIERYLRRPSAEALARSKERLSKYQKIREQETESRKQEGPMLATMEASLGIGEKGKVPIEGRILDEREEQVLLQAIKESSDSDPVELRETFIGSIRGQKIFKEQFASWKKQYSSDPQIQANMTLEDFVHQQGLRFIRENRKLIVRSRTDDFYEKNMKVFGTDEKADAENKKRFYGEVDMFIQANYEKMDSYNSLSPPEQKKLLGKFRVRVARAAKENEMDIKDGKAIDELFMMLTGDLNYETFATRYYEGTYKTEIENADLNLTDEEWEEKLRIAFEKNAKGELMEYLQQQVQPVFNVPAVIAAPEHLFSTVNDVAHESGVNLRAADPKEKDLYYIDFPTIKDEKYPFMLKVVYPKGSNDINDASFIIQQPWADKDAPEKGETIRNKTTRVFKPDEVPRAMNTLILDYILNVGISTSEKEKVETGINDIIKDETMIFMAERLFGFQLREKTILTPQIDLFKRFLTVLLRDDGKSSLETRVKKIDAVLRDDAMLPYIKESLQTRGAATKTIDGIIEEVNLRMQGKVK
jgi:hypothetical protein